MLAVASRPTRVLTPPLFESDDFRASGLLDQFARNGRSLHDRGSNRRSVWTDDHQHLIEGDLIAHFTGDPVNLDYIIGGDAVLPAACFDDCEHRSLPACSAWP
jgi:hypothetical protein